MKERRRNTEHTERAHPKRMHKEQNSSLRSFARPLGAVSLALARRCDGREMRDSAVNKQGSQEKVHRPRQMARAPSTEPMRGIPPSTIATPLECVVTRHRRAPASPVESADTRSLHAKSFGFCSYAKTRGVGGQQPQLRRRRQACPGC